MTQKSQLSGLNINDEPLYISNALNYESGTFTLSADGSTATGGTIVNNGDGTFTLTITTVKKLKKWDGLVSLDSNSKNFSSGSSDGTTQFCSAYSLAGSFLISPTAYIDQANCISVFDGSFVGYSGLINNVSPTSYSLLLTPAGGGGAITGQWIAATGNY